MHGLILHDGTLFAPHLKRSTGTEFARQMMQTADRIILSAYAPAAVVIDSGMHVQQFRGRTELYLEHTPGPATLNLMQMVRPSLAADLRNVISTRHSNKETGTQRARYDQAQD